jgi:hypothetical protein
VPGQVERHQPVIFDDARIGHQAMELPAVGAGCVHAQHILPLYPGGFFIGATFGPFHHRHWHHWR